MSYEHEVDDRGRPRDRKVDEAKQKLMQRCFSDGAKNVYYGRQLEIWFEDEFFHWITKKALNELAAEGRIGFEAVEGTAVSAHFYWPRRHRYPRRQMREVASLIREFSDPTFTRALGQHGELLADAGMAYTGFRIIRKEVREFGGARWTETDHNLDRIIERDGVRYGIEIKNQLGYIDQGEFQVKLAMCSHLKVRPFFIARMMPRNYIKQVADQGGFCLIVKNQHYPLMAADLAKRVRSGLALPVLSIRELPDTTMRRFEEWHERHLEKG